MKKKYVDRICRTVRSVLLSFMAARYLVRRTSLGDKCAMPNVALSSFGRGVGCPASLW